MKYSCGCKSCYRHHFRSCQTENPQPMEERKTMRTALAILTTATLMASTAFSQQASQSDATRNQQGQSNPSATAPGISQNTNPNQSPSPANQSGRTQANGQSVTGSGNLSNPSLMQMFQSGNMSFVSTSGQAMDQTTAMQRIQAGACMKVQGGQIVVEQ